MFDREVIANRCLAEVKARKLRVEAAEWAALADALLEEERRRAAMWAVLEAEML
jgi:hypothetical protein